MSDLISRSDVRMITSDGTAYSETWNFDYEQGFADALRSVLALPSVEPKTAKWMHDMDDISIAGYCSNCCWVAHIGETDVAGMPFCPNCGADMRGEE